MKKFPELFEMVNREEVTIYPAFLEVLYDETTFFSNNTPEEEYELDYDGICMLKYEKQDVVVFLHVFRSEEKKVPYYEISLYKGKGRASGISGSNDMQKAYQLFIKSCKQYA